MKSGNKLYLRRSFSDQSSVYEESLEPKTGKQKMWIKWVKKTHLFHWNMNWSWGKKKSQETNSKSLRLKYLV